MGESMEVLPPFKKSSGNISLDCENICVEDNSLKRLRVTFSWDLYNNHVYNKYLFLIRPPYSSLISTNAYKQGQIWHQMKFLGHYFDSS